MARFAEQVLVKSASDPAMKLNDMARQIVDSILALRLRQVHFSEVRECVLGLSD